MISYVIWYLIGGCIYIFIDVLRCAEEIKKMDPAVLIFATAAAGLFWPIVLMVQVFVYIVILALKVNNLFTKEPK